MVIAVRECLNLLTITWQKHFSNSTSVIVVHSCLRRFEPDIIVQTQLKFWFVAPENALAYCTHRVTVAENSRKRQPCLLSCFMTLYYGVS